jgi:hypothetical protein
MIGRVLQGHPANALVTESIDRDAARRDLSEEALRSGAL